MPAGAHVFTQFKHTCTLCQTLTPFNVCMLYQSMVLLLPSTVLMPTWMRKYLLPGGAWLTSTEKKLMEPAVGAVHAADAVGVVDAVEEPWADLKE